jgi:alpha-tubulin suppressor-like RCC1 family protein
MRGRRVAWFSLVSCSLVLSTACGAVLGIDDVTEAAGGAGTGGVGGAGGQGGVGGRGPGGQGSGGQGSGGQGSNGVGGQAGGAGQSGRAGEGGDCGMPEACANGVEQRCEGGELIVSPCEIGCDAGGKACVRPRAIGVGSRHACALLDDETVRCWGSDQDDELGDGGERQDAPKPRIVPAVGGATGLEVNFARTCVTGPVSAVCWGLAEAQVDVGGLPRPVVVSGGVQQVSLGRQHLCVVAGDEAKFLCRGSNFVGQLGDGTTTQPSGFVPVLSPPEGSTRIASGARHSCTIGGGGVSCWGDGQDKQNGDPESKTRRLPTTVSGLDGAVELAAGDAFTCARGFGGLVSCWGRNFEGQLGRGTSGDPESKAAVVDLAEVKRIEAGDKHACALTEGGSVFCWGSNDKGQLGNDCKPSCEAGQQSVSSKPVAVALPGVVDIAAGGQNTCALLGDGSVYCWGDNGRSQIGSGIAGGFERVPQKVVWK